MSLGKPNMFNNRLTTVIAAAVAFSAALAGCRKTEMHEQEKRDPLEPSALFTDGNASRPLVAGTVARGHARTDSVLFQGIGADGKPAAEFPWPMTAEDLKRGQDRYNIYCYVCHGQTGYGDGMVVRRGFIKPQSFHSQRLKDAPPGYYFQVVTNGFGAMYSYAERVSPEDRWRIAAYIRTLQLSQSQSYATLTAAEKALVDEPNKSPAGPSKGPAASSPEHRPASH
jgi:mono/diheme cytochrome c family protein